jgi:hypothetical protein
MQKKQTYTVIYIAEGTAVEYKAAVIEAVSPAAASTAVHKYAMEIIAVVAGKATLCEPWGHLPVQLPEVSVTTFTDLQGRQYLIADDKDVLARVSYRGHQELNNLLDMGCAYDGGDELYSDEGVKDIIRYFGEDSATPEGISCKFLQAMIDNPHTAFQELPDCPLIAEVEA